MKPEAGKTVKLGSFAVNNVTGYRIIDDGIEFKVNNGGGKFKVKYNGDSLSVSHDVTIAKAPWGELTFKKGSQGASLKLSFGKVVKTFHRDKECSV